MDDFPGPHDGPENAAAAQADVWFTPLRFAVLLAVCICAAFPEVVTGRHTFVFRDFGFFGYPLAYYHRESFWRGEVPLWNPLSQCGVPFLAQWNTLVLYPGSLFYLLFPLSWSLGVFCLLHQWLAGLGMYFLGRKWIGRRLGGSVGGPAFAFNGLTLNSLIWPAIMAALGWMPWVVLLAERAWQRGGKALVHAAVIGAVQMLCGAPELVLFTWLVSGVFLLCHAPSSDWRGKYFLRVLVVAFLIALLSAAQMLPFFYLVQNSQRDPGFATDEWTMPGNGWANLFVPLFRCLRSPAGIYFGENQSWTTSYYPGIGTLFLAVVALARVRDRRVWLLGAIAFLGFALALGEHGYLYGWLRKGLPFFGFMRYPIKFVLLLIFCAPVLARFGVRWMSLTAGIARREAWRTAAIIGGLFLPIAAGILRFDLRTETIENGTGRMAFLALIIGTLVAGGRFERVNSRVSVHLVLLALFFLDVIGHAPRQNPTVPRAVFEPGLLRLNPQPRLGETRAMISFSAHLKFFYTPAKDPMNDFIVSRSALFLNCNLLDSIPQVHGFFPLSLRKSEKVSEALDASESRPLPSLYDFLGISQMTAPGKYFDWESRPSCLPLVTAGQRPFFADDEEAFRGLTRTNFSPQTGVYLP